VRAVAPGDQAGCDPRQRRSGHDCHRVGLEQAAIDIAGLDQRHQRAHLGGIAAADRRPGLPLCRIERLALVGPADVQHAARGEQRVLGEIRGRISQKVATGAGERAHRRRAIRLREHRRGAPGAVVARLRLSLQKDDRTPRGQLEGDRAAGDAGSRDQHVCALPGHDRTAGA
jgi:hypothetical protein